MLLLILKNATMELGYPINSKVKNIHLVKAFNSDKARMVLEKYWNMIVNHQTEKTLKNTLDRYVKQLSYSESNQTRF